MQKNIHDKQNTKMLNEEHFYKQSNLFTESQEPAWSHTPSKNST